MTLAGAQALNHSSNTVLAEPTPKNKTVTYQQ